MYTIEATWSYDGGTTVGASAVAQHPAAELPGVVARLLASRPTEIKIRRQAMKRTVRGEE